MKLKIQNVARVSIAEIDLGGITVIAGANGTGKSTVSRALMTLSSVSKRIPKLVQAERLTSMVGNLRDVFLKAGANTFLVGEKVDVKSPHWAQWFSKDWWNDTEAVLNWLREGMAKQNVGSLLVFPSDFIDRPDCRSAIEAARVKIFEAMDRKDEDYVQYICKKAFSKAFCDQLKPVFSTESDSLIEVSENDLKCSIGFDAGNVDSFVDVGRTFFPTVMYFEPLNYVDFINVPEWRVSDRYAAGGLCVCRAINRKPSDNRLSLEQDRELQEAVQGVNEIVGIIHGRLVDDTDQEIKFSEKFTNGEFLIDVKNIASGMKTMAAIVRAVENRSIQRGSLLIIDEPESNLHPEWQVQFARFLVLLCKRLGITLLLNTHSPYFLQAIRKYAKIGEVKNRYYNMTSDGNGDSFHAENVTDRINVVFRDMAAPFDDLDVD